MPDIEEHIRRAIEDGKFADLPGKGKPISMDENPHEDPEWRLAHHMLRSSGFSLPWIEQRQDLEKDMASVRQALQQAWEWRSSESASRLPLAQVDAAWQQALQAFRTKGAELNRRIRDYNLTAPAASLQIRSLNIEGEIAALVN